MNENEAKVEVSTVPSNDERIAAHLRGIVLAQAKHDERHAKAVKRYTDRLTQLKSTGGGFTKVAEMEIREGTRCDACGRPHLRNAVIVKSASGTELTVSRKCADLLTATA